MKRILLTTTSLAMFAGVAAAETSITWSGVASAGVARTGKAAAVTVGATAINLSSIILDANAALDLAAAQASSTVTASATAAEIAAEIVVLRAASVELRNNETYAAAAYATADETTSFAKVIAALDVVSANLAALNGLDSAEVTTSDFQSYSEVNATVTGSVTTDSGMVLSAAVSVDAGQGYNFKDDEGFDAAAAGRVALDNITLNAGTLGTFKIDQDAITHLVDGDDDGNADLLYTNTLGAISVSAAVDLSTDVDDNATAAAANITHSGGSASAASFTLTDATTHGVAADVQWSAKVSMPVAGGTAYVAMDEEGGNVFGASTTVGGIGVSFSSSLEALEEGLSMDRSNTVGLTYVMGSVTTGASWNSKEDGDQWGISAAYAAADGLSISASTDEGSDWNVSGSYALGSGATVVGGVNYTEDAYLGLSFAF